MADVEDGFLRVQQDSYLDLGTLSATATGNFVALNIHYRGHANNVGLTSTCLDDIC
ncbi:UNVERIFIED_CONTAM: hypothetical protein Slati_4052200 [Sesamum latifolium]|uniref:Uncharacterized protein n=1 Tax=Sesamum latifolium TaxID=2727402 RepID=A0AAW2TR23_9LAMI